MQHELYFNALLHTVLHTMLHTVLHTMLGAGMAGVSALLRDRECVLLFDLRQCVGRVF